MSMQDLKHCPFCGGDADKYIDDYGEGKFYVNVRCSKCGAKVSRKGAIGAVTEEAVNAWNRRADEAKSAFDSINPEWLSLLLTFLSTDPPRRGITVHAENGGKSVNITYDPHDAEAVQAAETWRKALFSCVTQFKAVEPVAVKVRDIAPFGDDCRGQRGDMSPPAQRDTDDNPWTNPETTEKIARLYEFNAAVLPLKAYFAKHGSPRTRIIVTENGAEETEVVRGAPWDGGD